MMRRKSLGAAMALIGVMAVSGCSSEEPEARSGVLTNAEYVSSYQKIAREFTQELPEGVSLPETPPALDGDNIGEGNAAAGAYFFWSCAWQDVYLSSADPVARATALAELREFPRTDWALRYWDDPGDVWGATLDAAELGDLTDLRAFYEADCGHYRSEVGR
ncbi:hypothetical protein [Microbacterium sp. AG238]|nr:hypothetical protein [Microbacterium sp. AG238]